MESSMAGRTINLTPSETSTIKVPQHISHKEKLPKDQVSDTATHQALSDMSKGQDGSIVSVNRNASESDDSSKRTTFQRMSAVACSPQTIGFIVFFIITSITIWIIEIFAEAQQSAVKEKALDLAVDTGEWFSDQLDRAILPLFSMAQFATSLDIFRTLPDRIGVAGAPGSLPFINGTYLRNVTGVCDDPELVSRFTAIASGVKKTSKMDGLLVNIQLGPEGVLCLLHPMNNTEDFEDGEFLDNSGAWGLDLFEDPYMKFIARGSIKKEEVGIAGPLRLKQCLTCNPFFIARLPIIYDGHQIEVDGQAYNRWGFATALIHWTRLVEQSGIYESFAKSEFEFQLTRTDTSLNTDTGEYEQTVVVLAGTEEFEDAREDMEVVSTTLQTTNNEWRIDVLYSYADVNEWHSIVILISVIVAFFMAFLVFLILRQRRQHADMLSTTREKEAKVATERNITAYFAHELRNPLSAMDNALTIISDKNMPPATKELVDAMQRCCSFMSSIMNNLLDVRKLEEGKMEIRNNPFSVSNLLIDTHKMLASLVRPGVEFFIRNEVPQRSDWVLGDPSRIQQAFVNVCTNAIKYTPTGSITLKASWVGAILTLECIDTGPGIPKGEQEKLFERFVQRGGAPGTGLGLNISKQIAETMGGSIRFDSDPTIKPGTTCVISLPLNTCEASGEEGQSSSRNLVSEPIEEAISILIMDDIKLNRTMLSRRIKKFIAPNTTITMAETGEQALEICNEKTFDIMICDQYMEESGGTMVGTDFIVAARRAKSDAFIIGCSGNDLDKVFFEAGANIVWGKPLPKNEKIIDQFRAGLQEHHRSEYRRRRDEEEESVRPT